MSLYYNEICVGIHYDYSTLAPLVRYDVGVIIFSTTERRNALLKNSEKSDEI